LNPDAFVANDFLEKSVQKMEENPQCGALTGQTLKWDIESDRPTGTYDTTGIFSTWYGKWYDRDQGSPAPKKLNPQEIPAICGALFFAKKQALDQVLLQGNVFDPNFYMYKEDIDLSLRLKKRGWNILFFPDLIGYLCRGWNRCRKEVPLQFRICSAKNERTIHWREKKAIPFVYSCLKLFLVQCFNL
jgi:GT2 family glycosyltransferase